MLKIPSEKEVITRYKLLTLLILLTLRTLLSLLLSFRRLVKINRIFYGRADRKGGRGSATSALTVSKYENFDLFFIERGWCLSLSWSK